MKITVFTPTYNRENLLPRVYGSLCSQTDGNFEWLIVDDGSTDHTKGVVDKWIDENKIEIRYIYQPNSGKAIAFNEGIKNAKGELFLCVDSDDYLVDDAIEAILSQSESTAYGGIAGIIARKCDNRGKNLGDRFPENLSRIDTFSLSEKYRCKGEWTLIYKMAILKNCLFPEIANEKFITECVLYDKLAQTYEMMLFDKIIEVCEYQKDGLTSNIYKYLLENPTGYKIYYSQRIDMAYTWKARIGYIIRYNAFRRLSSDKDNEYTGKYRQIVRLLWFTGILGSLYYRRLGRNEKT